MMGMKVEKTNCKGKEVNKLAAMKRRGSFYSRKERICFIWNEKREKTNI